MSQERHPANPGAVGADKIETHHRQQLSALIDGALAPDEARFLLRRLEHDDELAGCYERWQLCGDVMRGQVARTADAGFSQRVAAALATEAAVEAVRPMAATTGRRHGWARWGGGGAALAASVAVVAMFVGRQQDPVIDAGPAPLVAEQRIVEPAPAPAAVAPASAPAAVAVASAAVAAAAAPVARTTPRREAAPRTPAIEREPVQVAAVAPVRDERTVDAASRQVADVLPLPTVPTIGSADNDPFASAAPLQARPWPRAALPQAASGAFNASIGERGDAGATFYPFEPRLPAEGVSPRADLPAPPDADTPTRR